MKVVVLKAPDMPGGCSVEDDPSELFLYSVIYLLFVWFQGARQTNSVFPPCHPACRG